MGCLVLGYFICKKIKNLDLDNVPLAKNLNQNTVAFYYKLELKYYFKELLLLESDSLPPEKGFVTPTGVITPTLRTTALGDSPTITFTTAAPVQPGPLHPDDDPAYAGPYRRQSYDSLLGSFRHSSRQGSDNPPRKRLRL